nr:MAG TPA: hypothetical protein [Caudoviricetes sp.]
MFCWIADIREKGDRREAVFLFTEIKRDLSVW